MYMYSTSICCIDMSHSQVSTVPCTVVCMLSNFRVPVKAKGNEFVYDLAKAKKVCARVTIILI